MADLVQEMLQVTQEDSRPPHHTPAHMKIPVLSLYIYTPQCLQHFQIISFSWERGTVIGWAVQAHFSFC